MANQAIALQARAPQTNPLGGAIQQGAQMINMMQQQRAAERQAMQAQQAMELARAAEGRAVTAEERAARKANQDFVVAEVSRLIDRGAAVGDEAGYQMWLSQVEKVSPEDAALFRQYSPAFDPNKMNNILMGAEQYINKTIATPEASLQVGKDLETYSATVGGTRPGVRPLMVEGAPSTARAGAPATDAQIDEAARAIVGGAGIQDGPLRGLSPQDFDRATERANQITAGGGRMQPVSMTTGAQMGGQPDMTAVVQDMMASKQISQSNLQLMREMAGPDKDQQLAQILKANNIQIVPDGQPGMRSAEFRPGEDAAPQMQLAQATNAPGTQFRVAKDPTQSPAPGIYSVPTPVIAEVEEAQREPIPRVRQRAAAERASPEEVEATERAKAQADADVKFMERFQTDRDSTRQMLGLIKSMIGDTYVKDGRLYYKKGGRGPHPGFEDVVGATWRPGWRFVPGTDAADFDAMLEQIEGGTFLEAFERLKGGGQITETEGVKATRAISRMQRSVSEKEFVTAAREFESIVRSALKRAEDRYNRLRGGSAPAPAGERRPRRPLSEIPLRRGN